jgi:hypothetical protein
MKPLANSIYAVLGIVFLLTGATVFILPTGLLPDNLEGMVLDFGRGDLGALHIIQEFGSLMIFAGLITFWFVRHYEKSAPFHWALTVFWGFFALAHWFDARGNFESGTSQMVISALFVLFVLIGLLRKRFDRRAR